MLVACKKEGELVLDNTKTANNPIFYVKGTYRGVPISYIAGNDNRYMFSNTYNLGMLDVFQGELKNENCPSNCPTSLEILLSSNQNDSTGAGNFIADNFFYRGYSPHFYINLSQTGDFINRDTANVIVKYRNSNGSLLSSSSSQLNFSRSSFRIDSVSDYQNNINGQKTKRVVFSLFCYLSDSSGNGSDSLSLNGAFAFAYP